MSDAINYPDLTDIFAAKTKLRQARAAMSAEEKLGVLDKLKGEAAGLREVRLAREAALRALAAEQP